MQTNIQLGDVAQFRPIGNRVQIDFSVIDLARELGGIQLPPGAKPPTPPFIRCRAISVGPECKLVKAGDHLLLSSVSIITADTEPYFSFTEEPRVIAVLELKPKREENH